MHPDVWDAGAGLWNGHRYWMVCTPYTYTDASVEKVCILVSDNKRAWSVPAGLTNPITPVAHSDPDMVNEGGTLKVIYRHAGDTIYLMTSTDGITWSEASSILTGASNTLLSPSLVYYGGQWVMFTVNYDAGTPTNSTITKRTCATLDGTWSEPTTCTISIPGGKYAWHLDVIVDGTTLYMALNLSASSLYLASSADGGDTWTVEGSPLFTSWGVWDTNIYRTTILRTATGFDVWYSANDGTGSKAWFIGYLAVTHA